MRYKQTASRGAPYRRSSAPCAGTELALRLSVRRIEAIIKPFKLDDAKAALAEIGIEGITVTQVRGYGRQKGQTEVYRGAEYVVDMLPKLELDLVVHEDRLETVLNVLTKACQTGRIGDGKIFVTEVGDALRIRTGERGSAAIS